MNPFREFAISSDEYEVLEKEFSQLCYFVSWQLMQNNCKNNHQHEIDDFKQELLLSVIRAGSYYKRQTWIESVFELLNKYIPEDAIIWHNVKSSVFME